MKLFFSDMSGKDSTMCRKQVNKGILVVYWSGAEIAPLRLCVNILCAQGRKGAVSITGLSPWLIISCLLFSVGWQFSKGFTGLPELLHFGG
jgi:hypothetical protein